MKNVTKHLTVSMTIVVALDSCSILSLLTAIKGSPCEFDLFAFGRALSSQPTPYQVLKIKISKTTKSPLLTIPQKTVPFLDSLSLSCILFKKKIDFKCEQLYT